MKKRLLCLLLCALMLLGLMPTVAFAADDPDYILYLMVEDNLGKA